eukprot:jgi/Mesvir1/13688/Mv02122-RA.1
MMFHRLLTDEECDYIIKLATPRMERSTVVDHLDSESKNLKSRTDDIRTSTGCFIKHHEDPVVDELKRRVADWSKLPVQNGEELQVLHYGVGQQYRAHQDTFPEAMLDAAGQRIATMLLYLNTPEGGGETVFPRVAARADQLDPANKWSQCGQRGYGVRPHKGDGILFWDLNPDNSLDFNSMHTSCPVTAGENATVWIHTGDFMHRAMQRPGGLCADQSTMCEGWAQSGECRRNPEYMVGQYFNPGSCIISCLRVDPHIFDGTEMEGRCTPEGKEVPIPPLN